MMRVAKRGAAAAGLAVGLLLIGTPDLRGQESPVEAGPGGRVSLEQAVSTALRSNRELRLARLELEKAGKQVGEALGGLLPEIDADLSYQRNVLLPKAFLPAIIFDPNASPDDLIPVQFGADNQWSAGVSVSQPLFDAGLFIGLGTAARFRSLQAEVVRGEAQQIGSEVRSAYFDVLLARERLRVTANSVARVERTLEETKAMNRSGLASDYDVLRLEVQLANLRPNLRRNRNTLEASQRILAIGMGLGEDRTVEVAGELHSVDLEAGAENTTANRELLRFAGYQRALEASVEELRAAAFRLRSDARQARLDRELRSARVGFERSNLLPRLSGFFNYRLTAQQNGSPNFFGSNRNQRTSAAEVGVRLEVPVFAGLTRWSRVSQRKVELRQSEVRLADIERKIDNEIRSAVDGLAEARSRAGAQRLAVGQAHRGFEIVTAEYGAGTAARLEVTDAENALRESELNYAQAVYDYLAAQAALDQAVGVVPVVDPVMGAGNRQAAKTNGRIGREGR